MHFGLLCACGRDEVVKEMLQTLLALSVQTASRAAKEILKMLLSGRTTIIHIHIYTEPSRVYNFSFKKRAVNLSFYPTPSTRRDVRYQTTQP
jgi:hypothetical protein